MKDSAYGKMDLPVPYNSRTAGSPSPMKNRVVEYGLHGHHRSLLLGSERLLYHPYKYSSFSNGGSLQQHTPPIKNEYTSPIKNEYTSHIKNESEESSFTSPRSTTSEGQDTVARVTSKTIPENLYPAAQHHHQISNNNNNGSSSSSNIHGESRVDKVDSHNHSSDSGLNDSGTSSAVSLDIDTSDSGVVSGQSGLSAHTSANSDDDVTEGTPGSGQPFYTNCRKTEILTPKGQDQNRQRSRPSLSCAANITVDDDEPRTMNDDDDDDIRVSSNDDDDDEERLRSFDHPALAMNDNSEGRKTPLSPTAVSHGRDVGKFDSDDRGGAHTGDLKGRTIMI